MLIKFRQSTAFFTLPCVMYQHHWRQCGAHLSNDHLSNVHQRCTKAKKTCGQAAPPGRGVGSRRRGPSAYRAPAGHYVPYWFRVICGGRYRFCRSSSLVFCVSSLYVCRKQAQMARITIFLIVWYVIVYIKDSRNTRDLRKNKWIWLPPRKLSYSSLRDGVFKS